jgi:hypothetical protein
MIAMMFLQRTKKFAQDTEIAQHPIPALVEGVGQEIIVMLDILQQVILIAVHMKFHKMSFCMIFQILLN